MWVNLKKSKRLSGAKGKRRGKKVRIYITGVWKSLTEIRNKVET
jgi:hypothetical protein